MLQGKVAIVSGAGRGLRRSLALAMAAESATIVVNDLYGDLGGGGDSRTPAEEVVAAVRASGGSVSTNYDDVASDEAGHVSGQSFVVYGGLIQLLEDWSAVTAIEKDDGWRLGDVRNGIGELFQNAPAKLLG
jgi:NAD(P)-dependent dehydrogenase (short-subunit alcohol dehydrogenase family)